MDHYKHTQALEWMSAWNMLIFGIFVVLPFDSFPNFPRYYYVNMVTSEWRYGTVAILLGIFQMVSLRAHQCAFGREGRMIAASLSAGGWLILGTLLAMGRHHVPEWLVYVCLSIAMLYSVHHLHRALERRPL